MRGRKRSRRGGTYKVSAASLIVTDGKQVLGMYEATKAGRYAAKIQVKSLEEGVNLDQAKAMVDAEREIRKQNMKERRKWKKSQKVW